jgi:hypothetical protein
MAPFLPVATTFSPSRRRYNEAKNKIVSIEDNEGEEDKTVSDIQDFNKQKKVSEMVPEKTTEKVTEKTVDTERIPYTVPKHHLLHSIFVIFLIEFIKLLLQIFPILAAICLCLVFILSVIFFGRREGQHWRDFKVMYKLNSRKILSDIFFITLSFR